MPASEHVVVVRFDGALYLEAVANNSTAKHRLIVGDGINQLDASGEEIIRRLAH